MLNLQELPDCFYNNKPVFITPNSPSPEHLLYLNNLDDQKFLRFSVKYLYLFRNSVNLDALKSSLSRVLIDYYPLAGRLRISKQDDKKLEVHCNGEGALFAEGFMDFSADEFLQISHNPNSSWRKLLYNVEAQSSLDVPPLVIQATNLRCGGMFLCAAIHHSLCDAIGTSQFLQAWAYLTKYHDSNTVPTSPFHHRHLFKSRDPSQVTSNHPGFTKMTTGDQVAEIDLHNYLVSQTLVPSSLIFTSSDILRLKRMCTPSLKCTTFDALASHTWRSWVKSLGLHSSLEVKLLFSVNVRKILKPQAPQGYYGNAFVLGCAETKVKELVSTNLHKGVKLVQEAKLAIDNDCIRSIVDLLEDKMVKPDLGTALVISQWSKLGLEDLDFGEGKPIHMGPLTSGIYCYFLPVIGDVNAVRVLVSMPENAIEKFEYYMKDFSDREDKRECNANHFNNVDGNNGNAY